LWLEDPSKTFEKFLIENDPAEDEFLKDDVAKVEEQKTSDIYHKENPLLKGVRAKIPYLDLFDEKIT
jgi:dynein heavy chain, axonemal